MRLSSAITALIGVVGALVAPACGEPRRFGDTDGQPVTMLVHLNRSFLSRMTNMQGRASVGAGAGFSPGGGAFMGSGLSFSFSTTEVDLLGGDVEFDAGVFDQQVHWGDTAFEVPLQPGRRLFLTLQANGGREGVESLGSILVPASGPARVEVTLSAAEAVIVISPPPAAPPPPPSPPALPPGPSGPTGPPPGAASPIAPQEAPLH